MKLNDELTRRCLELADVTPVRSDTEQQSEKAFQGAVQARARELGYKVYHAYDSRRSESGWPDLAIVGRGRAFFWELKTDTGKPTAAQLCWLEELKEAGLNARIVRPSDWPWIEEVLSR